MVLRTTQGAQPIVKPSIPLLLSRRSMANFTKPYGPPSSLPLYHPPRPRRFAPINPSYPDTHSAPTLKGIIFDVDGTLCLPQNYMFREMRSALSIPQSVDILDHIRSLSNEPDPSITPNSTSTSTSANANANTAEPLTMHPSPTSPQSRAVATVQAIERNAMLSQTPQPGLTQLMTYLSSHNIPKALCTRNFPAPVMHLLQKYLPNQTFWPIVTRDTAGVRAKPSPEGIWWIAKQWGLDADVVKVRGQVAADDTHEGEQDTRGTKAPNPGFDKLLQAGLSTDQDPLELAKRHLGANLIMVGDSIDDLAAGYRAGAATVLLVNEENEHLAQHEYLDVAVQRLDDLVDVLDQGFEGRMRRLGT